MHRNFQQFRESERRAKILSIKCSIYLHINAQHIKKSEEEQLIINNANMYPDAVSFDNKIQCTFVRIAKIKKKCTEETQQDSARFIH